MNSLKTKTNKHSLYIIDADHYYALTVKQSLIKKYGEDIRVEVFKNAESALEEMKRTINKPHVVLIDYLQSKESANENGEYVIETIKKISPDAILVILSSEKNEDNALRLLAHGAQRFVLKDQFALDHIYIAVENCLHPSKV